MRAVARRLLALAVLVLWTVPGVVALGVSLHVAGHHVHHAPAGQHRSHHHQAPDGGTEHIAELLQTALHGHRHDVGKAPDHHHDARLGSPSPGVRMAASPSADLPAPCGAPTTASHRSFHPTRGVGPPAPLFRTHCALLL